MRRTCSSRLNSREKAPKCWNQLQRKTPARNEESANAAVPAYDFDELKGHFPVNLPIRLPTKSAIYEIDQDKRSRQKS